MGRSRRVATGEIVYHVLNRANSRARIFHKSYDYIAFEKITGQACARTPMRILAYCLMPNHWHFVLWPRKDGEMSTFMAWLEMTHATRWHNHYDSVGTGHLYQGRFKSFPVSTDRHLLSVIRYVESNALRAGMVRRAEEWRWSSLWWHAHASLEKPEWLSEWPMGKPNDWIDTVNGRQSDEEVGVIRTSLMRGRPFGAEDWQKDVAHVLGLDASLRPRGRPKKNADRDAS